MNIEELLRKAIAAEAKASRKNSKDIARVWALTYADPYLIAEELGRGPQIGFGPSGARATLDNLTAA